ncbi:MAG: flippase-like domain-containing protein [Bryobacterales bacterium]|nr:flippase-like domain-containing protein [Bryobacterales bacterium]MBV9398669.1 flippase-like domain-containing protein [Bryobacterales bacterium]
MAALVWALRDARLGDFKDDLVSMDWKWVALALVVQLAVYLIYAMRWSSILRPVVRMRFWQSVRYVFVGLFGNEVLPFKAGEVLRPYLLSRHTALPFSVAITSVLIERIFDGIWLCLGLAVVLRFIHFPHQFRYLVDGAWVLGGLVVGGALLLAVAMFRRNGKSARTDKRRKGWRRQWSILLEDLALIGHSRYLYLGFFQSLPALLLQVIPVWAAFKGYLFDLSVWDAFALLIIMRLIFALPQAPANIGLFQLLTREVLIKIFGISPGDAGRFSVVLWGIVTLPLIAGGWIAVWLEEADVLDLKRAAEDHAAQMKLQRDMLD